MPVLIHYQIIGQNVSECRKSMHLTQEQLAELAGISQQFLSRIESGCGVPSVQTVMALCNAMDVEASRLLTRNSATSDAEAPSRLRSDGNSFCDILHDMLIAPNGAAQIAITMEDLPEFDLEIPDPFSK